MSEKKYRKFTPKFKKQALELLTRGDKSASELERELEITPGLLGKWRSRYQMVGSEGQVAKIAPSKMGALKAAHR